MFKSQFRWRSGGDLRLQDGRIAGLQEVKEEKVADRIAGCLKGVASGDAIGKQTEMLSHDDVLRWYPEGIRGFEGAPNAIIPRYAGNARHQWRIGETTDDTERTVAVARAIIAERAVSHVSIGREMLGCT